MPLPRPMQSGSSSGKKGGPVSHINMPVVFITTEDGTRGIGYAWSLLGGATATQCVLRVIFFNMVCRVGFVLLSNSDE